MKPLRHGNSKLTTCAVARLAALGLEAVSKPGASAPRLIDQPAGTLWVASVRFLRTVLKLLLVCPVALVASRLVAADEYIADIVSEANAPLSTSAGSAGVWYLNMNPTPNDISDKSGRGHHPTWAGSGRPALWSQ